MSVFVDFNNVVVAHLFALLDESNHIDEGLIRHSVINNLMRFKCKYEKEYGDLIVCADGSALWRKDVFPYYKASRTKSREKSVIDWSRVYEVIALIGTEISEHLPYRYLKVPKAECDDSIAVLDQHLPGNHMIVSNDKDFAQLQKFKGVAQYASLKEQECHFQFPERILKEHIIRGDVGDGVPNILSDDDTFVVPGKRQKPIFTKNVEVWLDQDWKQFCDSEKYDRNKVMIDFSYIPDDVKDEIIKHYDAAPVNDRKKIMPYFQTRGLRRLIEDIQFF